MDGGPTPGAPPPMTGPRPGTFTGRSEPLGDNPSLADLHREREELRAANHGRFTVEEPTAAAPRPDMTLRSRDPIFSVLIVLVCMSTTTLCLVLWTLFTVARVSTQGDAAETSRIRIATVTAAIEHQADQNGERIQRLIDRVDDVLIRLGHAPPPPPPAAR